MYVADKRYRIGITLLYNSLIDTQNILRFDIFAAVLLECCEAVADTGARREMSNRRAAKVAHDLLYDLFEDGDLLGLQGHGGNVGRVNVDYVK